MGPVRDPEVCVSLKVLGQGHRVKLLEAYQRAAAIRLREKLTHQKLSIAREVEFPAQSEWRDKFNIM